VNLDMPVAIIDGEESFAELFEASLKSPKKAIARRDPEVGEVVQGEVVQIGTEYAFLDIGAKAEALISLEELRGEGGELTIQIGDTLEGHVISVGGKEGGEIMVSGKLQRGAGLRDQLRLAYEQGIPVEGLVTGVNKGGLDLDLGGVRAFLPASQIELRYCQDPSSYVGRSLTVKVTRYDEDARNVVVSRRAVLEVEQRAMAERTREKLIPGAVFNGVVTSVQSYGAFVDIGGLEGLVHVSELGYGRGLRPDEVVKPGQRVEVVVLKTEQVEGQANPKVGLSLKALMADPMDEMLATLKEGERVEGKVVRLEAFGAFVELAPGVEGLIHISAMADRHVAHPREVVALNSPVTATVISLDRERRRIGLSLVEELRAAQLQAASTLKVGEVVKAAVERVEPYGVIVRVKRAEEGTGPQPKGTIVNAELGVPKGADVRRLFPAGREIQALIQSIEADGTVKLSIRAAEMQEEHGNISAYTGQAAQAAGKATLGEMLRSKLAQGSVAPASAAPAPAAEEPAAAPAPAPAKETKAAKAKAPSKKAAAAAAAEATAQTAAAAPEAAAAAPAPAKAAKAKAPAQGKKAAAMAEAAPAAAEAAPAAAGAAKKKAASKKA
jgi:small subunit ribosomal protein S1